MAYRINHIHLKSPDPRKTAEWYVTAFGFEIASDETRVFGDRFVRCKSSDGGIAVNISGARTNEKMGTGDARPHYGLEQRIAFLQGPDDTRLELVEARRIAGGSGGCC
jgi:lactoylglutathione lyase